MALETTPLSLLREAQAAAAHLSLPFRARAWRGHVGNWQGVGTGSSIDFQDHRPYLPGDDPRYIDWRAYARTGHYTMKLYRDETSPRLDLVVDASASMQLGEPKWRRVRELVLFFAESARLGGASLHAYALAGSVLRRLQLEPASLEADFAGQATAAAPELSGVPWRPGSLRVLVSDLLFPGAPDALLTPLTITRGAGLIFAPFSAEEATPDWRGNLEMEDCETGERSIRQVSTTLLERYREGYQRHFSLWREAGRRHAIPVARVAAEGELRAALQAEALPLGALELC